MSEFSRLKGQPLTCAITANGLEWTVVAEPFTVHIIQDHAERYTMHLQFYQRVIERTISSSLFNALVSADVHIELFERKRARDGYNRE